MNTIRNVIFDFDGTLADTQGAIRKSFLKTVEGIRAPVPIGPFFDEFSSHTLEGMLREVGVVKEQMLREAVSQYCGLYGKLGPKSAKRFFGITGTLDRLREFNFTLAIGTNERRSNLESLLLPLNLRGYFAVTVCEDEVSLPKPHPDMLHKILDKIGESPSNTLMIGDSVLDIAAGKAAGCYTCAVTYGSHPKAKLQQYSPDWVIDHPLDLLSVLNLPPHPVTHTGRK